MGALAVGDDKLNVRGDGFTLSEAAGGGARTGLSRLAGSGILSECWGYNVGEL